MDYIKELRAFQNFMIKNDLPKGAITLWYTLMNIKMTEGEEIDWLSVPNKTIECLAGLSRQGVINARESLKQCGLIDFVEGKGRKRSPQYYLLSLVSEEEQQPTESVPPAEEKDEKQEEMTATVVEKEKTEEEQKKFKRVWNFVQTNFDVQPTFQYDVRQHLAVFHPDLMLEAFSRAKKLQKPYGYGIAILKNWRKQHVQTMDDVKKLDAAWGKNHQGYYNYGQNKTSLTTKKRKIERIPEWHNEPDKPVENWEETRRILEERVRNL